MSVIDNLQALRIAADTIVSLRQTTPLDTAQLTFVLDHFQETARFLVASIPLLTHQQMDHVMSQVLLVVRPLRTTQQSLTVEYGTGLTAHFAAAVNTPTSFEYLRNRFLNKPKSTGGPTPYTRKVLRGIPANEFSSHYRLYNIPAHADNFVAGLVLGDAPTHSQETKDNALALLDAYINSKRLRAKNRYNARPTVAPLLAVIEKFKETMLVINTVSQEICSRRASAAAVSSGPSGLGYATEFDRLVRETIVNCG